VKRGSVADLKTAPFPPSLQEIANAVGDFPGVGFRREVAGSKKRTTAPGMSMPPRYHNAVPFESFGSGRQEERVVLAPHRQKRWLVGAKVFLGRK
jgi:hypothetical protein